MVVSEIAVIGGGAAGIIASRHLIQYGFRPTIFEKRHVLGGLWHSSNDILSWKKINTNLSKFTCCFSELPWDEEQEMFPSREKMQSYLNLYSNKYLDKERCNIKYNCEVIKVSKSDMRFKVEWKEQEESFMCNFYDGLVVATGFFSDCYFPKKVNYKAFTGQHLHSSQYHSSTNLKELNVAIIGASFSALEIAADVAKYANRVINILPRIPYVLPRYLPVTEEDSKSFFFQPLDLAFYRRNKSYPQRENLIPDEESCRKKHAFLQSFGSAMQKSLIGFPEDVTSPVYVSISDSYLNYVAMDKIKVIEDVLTTCKDRSLFCSSGKVIDNIDVLISCTGYKTNLSFLSDEILKELQYDPTNQFAPLILCMDTYHPSIPNLGFVGMYRGPYFGIMELQARYIAHLMSTKHWEEISSLDLDEINDSLRIRNQKPRPQFPHSDYVGQMDTLSERLNLIPQPDFTKEGDYIIPAFYQPNYDVAKKSWKNIETEIKNAKKGKNIPNILIYSLVGKWKFHRSISYTDINSNDESVSGNVIFSEKEKYLLYHEDGIYQTSTGASYPIFREYCYIANSSKNSLDIYFVENHEKGEIFLRFLFHPSKQQNGQNEGLCWEASADHLCLKDLYKGKIFVRFEGVSIVYIRMEYNVKGPKKDYVSVTELRPEYLHNHIQL